MNTNDLETRLIIYANTCPISLGDLRQKLHETFPYTPSGRLQILHRSFLKNGLYKFLLFFLQGPLNLRKIRFGKSKRRGRIQ